MMRWIIAGTIGALLVLALLASDGDTSNYDAERTQRTAIAEAERTNRETIQQAERTQRTAIEQAAQTDRTAIGESAQTERTYISAQQLMWMATEREATLRLLLVSVAIIVAVTGAVVVAVLILRSRAPLLPIPDPPMPEPPPPHARRIVQRLPAGHRLEYDADAGWVIVLPNGRQFYTVEDAQRLIEQR